LCNENKKVKQYLLTPAAGKRLISKSILFQPLIKDALKTGTVVIISGTTNGYIAEEILREINQVSGFSKKYFIRGVTVSPDYVKEEKISSEEANNNSKDVVIVKGKWEKELTIFDVAPSLQSGDVIIKGANALDVEKRQAAIYIGHPKLGTIGAALQSILGKRAQLFLPVGLEKRITGDINAIALKLNSLDSTGPRLFPVSGNIITEIDAIKIITGADAQLVAAGGICGAEGSCWLAIEGTLEQLKNVDNLYTAICREPRFEL
jgi:hypothetical protein